MALLSPGSIFSNSSIQTRPLFDNTIAPALADGIYDIALSYQDFSGNTIYEADFEPELKTPPPAVLLWLGLMAILYRRRIFVKI